MKKMVVLLVVGASTLLAQEMLVRVYARARQDLAAIAPKLDLDIASARAGQWYDVVANRAVMDRIIASGLTYEVRIPSLALAREQVRGEYHSYAEVNTLLRNMAANYPAICKLDSLPITTYEGRWLYGVKISDFPGIEDTTEPGYLIDALHHSREWATPEVVLFFADSVLRAYATVPEIQQIVDNIEIYCFPIINADGFVYDYPGELWWRLNREPFEGEIGTDPNRNYGGCSGDLDGDWGAVDQGEATHTPGDETFCGAYRNSGDETRSLAMYIREHMIHAYMSYHSYAEYLMWGWGWDTDDIPDVTACARLGNRMAGMINCIGGGTYDAGQIPEILYEVSGGSIDWVYGYNQWISGIANLSYTTEVGTSFYQPTGDLDGLVRQNFKALKYLAQLCRDSIAVLCEGRVPPPRLYPIDTVPGDFTVSWHPFNTEENHPTHWELVELSGRDVRTDSLESGTARWILEGFTLSTTYSHSSSHSYFSGNAASQNTAVRTAYPYLVQPGDSVTFWCRYSLEPDYDVAVVEASENTKEWFNLDTMRFNGSQTTWVRKAYSLAAWTGKSIYIRFRCMYDGGVQNGGFYVDDISPVCSYATVDTVSSAITDTCYTFTDHPGGDYWFMVRGYNTRGWGEYSCLASGCLIGIAEHAAGDGPTRSLRVSPSVFAHSLTIDYAVAPGSAVVLSVHDATGRCVRNLMPRTRGTGSLRWDGRDDQGRLLPNGVYFVRLESRGDQAIEKAVIVR